MNFPEISISGEKVFEFFNFPLTATFLLTLLIAAAVFILFFFSLKKREMLPGALQNFIEWIFEKILDFIDGVTGDRKKTEEIFPLACSLFILILFSNLLEILPGLGVFHFLRSPSSDLNFTLALALFSMSYINVLALKKLGLFSYLKKFFNFKNPLLFFVGLLEGMSEFIRILSLSVRLFGNLFAGEVLLIITSFLFAYLLPLPFLGLEILVGFIQAIIFSSLIVIFYTVATHLEYEK